MTDAKKSKVRLRLKQLFSVPSALFLFIFLVGCFIFGGLEFAILIGIGALVGLSSAAWAVISRRGGTFRFTLNLLFIAMIAISGIFLLHQYRPMNQKQAYLQILGIGGSVKKTYSTDRNEARAIDFEYATNLSADDIRPIIFLEDVILVRLNGHNIGNEGLRYVGRLTDLKHLSLDNTGITDAGIKRLSRLHALETVSLNGNDVTDDGLMRLANLKFLRHVGLENTKVTEQGVKEFQKRLPNCYVEGIPTRRKTVRRIEYEQRQAKEKIDKQWKSKRIRDMEHKWLLERSQSRDSGMNLRSVDSTN